MVCAVGAFPVERGVDDGLLCGCVVEDRGSYSACSFGRKRRSVGRDENCDKAKAASASNRVHDCWLSPFEHGSNGANFGETGGLEPLGEPVPDL